jgi:hypothetical protein
VREALTIVIFLALDQIVVWAPELLYRLAMQRLAARFTECQYLCFSDTSTAKAVATSLAEQQHFTA